MVHVVILVILYILILSLVICVGISQWYIISSLTKDVTEVIPKIDTTLTDQVNIIHKLDTLTNHVIILQTLDKELQTHVCENTAMIRKIDNAYVGNIETTMCAYVGKMDSAYIGNMETTACTYRQIMSKMDEMLSQLNKPTTDMVTTSKETTEIKLALCSLLTSEALARYKSEGKIPY